MSNHKEIVIDLPLEVFQILEHLRNHQYEAFVVGGCVRDSLSHQTPKDYDVTTNATPNEVQKIFSEYRCIPTGLKHGTITVINNKMQIEITTYRTDGTYEDDHRHPKEVTFTNSLLKDLERRDLTINAMAYSPWDGLIDPFNGIHDLKSETIRCVGNPNIRFFEDALRMLRAIRFRCQFDFTFDNDTFLAIIDQRTLLHSISHERIRDELCKIIKCGRNGLFLLYTSGLLQQISPELHEMFNCQQNNPHHFTNVGHHTCLAIDSFVKTTTASDAFTILTVTIALLLHDVGKIRTRTTDSNGCDHFYNHAKASIGIATDFLNKYKFSNKEKMRILDLIEFHDYTLRDDMTCLYKILIKHCIYPETVRSLIDVKNADSCAQNIAHDKVQSNLQFFAFYIKMTEVSHIPYRIKDLACNGTDIIHWIPEVNPTMIKLVLADCLTLCFYKQSKNTKENLSKFILNNKAKYLKGESV